jgi:hypothetical protein
MSNLERSTNLRPVPPEVNSTYKNIRVDAEADGDQIDRIIKTVKECLAAARVKRK